MGRILRGRGARGRNVRGRGARGRGPDDANPYQHIIDIFGIDDILLLVASDGEGGLKDYVPPRFVRKTDTTETADIPPLTESFETLAVQTGTIGNIAFYDAPLITDFSLGMFVKNAPQVVQPIAQINNIVCYFATSNRLMIRNGVEGTNNYSPSEFANLAGPDFLVWEADSALQQMVLRAVGGTHVISSYPSSMHVDLVRVVHQGTSGVDYQSQFWILLNRTMTDTEIAQVRAFL